MDSFLGVEPPSPDRLDEYMSLYRSSFARSDQARWASVYIRGLLQAGERKNIEALARRVVLPPDLRIVDPAQALQNFINQSSRDESRLWQRYRELFVPIKPEATDALVLTETLFPKRGRHSVGVHRQIHPEAGGKTNSQTAVTLHLVGPARCLPLGLRLYLPKSWFREPQRLAGAGVPDSYHRHRTKLEVGLGLMEESGWFSQRGLTLMTDPVFGNTAEFVEEMALRGWTYFTEVDGDTWVQPVRQGRSGLKTWPAGPATLLDRVSAHGSANLSLRNLARELSRYADWLPGGLVDADSRYAWTRVRPGSGAFAPPSGHSEEVWLLVKESDRGPMRFAFANLPLSTPAAVAARLWQQKETAAAQLQALRRDLGLDHFEGRSWRGFHHHACLVTIAHGYTLWAGQTRAERPAAEPAMT